jgi:hypothetical protein
MGRKLILSKELWEIIAFLELQALFKRISANDKVRL